MRSLENLREHLLSLGVPIESWTGVKGLPELWSEIELGESRIEDGVRLVRTAAVLVRRADGAQLFESSYVRDGASVVRSHLPWSVAEKCLPDETFEDAALRCLREELGIEAADLTFETEEIRESDSPAYPGLPLRNTTRTFSCTVSDPKERYVEQSATATITWTWRSDRRRSVFGRVDQR